MSRDCICRYGRSILEFPYEYITNSGKQIMRTQAKIPPASLKSIVHRRAKYLSRLIHPLGGNSIQFLAGCHKRFCGCISEVVVRRDDRHHGGKCANC